MQATENQYLAFESQQSEIELDLLTVVLGAINSIGDAVSFNDEVIKLL